MTTTKDYVYQEVDGEYIQVGEILESAYDVIESVDASDYALPIIDSEDDVEEMTLEEIEALEEEGAIASDVVPVLGDPSDQDYTETQVQLYTDIEINSVEDSLFRIEW